MLRTFSSLGAVLPARYKDRSVAVPIRSGDFFAAGHVVGACRRQRSRSWLSAGDQVRCLQRGQLACCPLLIGCVWPQRTQA